jgi:hypothetical protein
LEARRRCVNLAAFRSRHEEKHRIMGTIPSHVIEQVASANDIVEVIGSYFPLKRAGANFRALDVGPAGGGVNANDIERFGEEKYFGSLS